MVYDEVRSPSSPKGSMWHDGQYTDYGNWQHILNEKLECTGQLPDVLDVVEEAVQIFNVNDTDDKTNNTNNESDKENNS